MGASCCVSISRVRALPSPQRNTLMFAAASGDVAALKEVLRTGIEVNASDRSGRTALHLACSEGHEEFVSTLLANKANPNVQDKRGHEPLQEAMLVGRQNIVKILTKAGASLSKTSRSSLEMQLQLYFATDNLEKLKLLFDSGYCGQNFQSVFSLLAQRAFEKGQVQLSEYLGGHEIQQKHKKEPLKPLDDFDANNLTNRTRAASFLLMEVCPKAIAEATMDGRKAEPISRDCASLFFSDVVNFTAISSTLPASSVARMLQRLFHSLDRLATAHGVQKVDVVGDAYIAATNFTEPQAADHAARLARFALDAVAAAQAIPVDDRHPDAGGLQIRVGLHCGPVSGILADSAALKYTLIGETACRAARMESSGVPGRVQCSSVMAVAIHDQAHDVSLLPRARGGPDGEVTYWVDSLRWRRRRRSSCTSV